MIATPTHPDHTIDHHALLADFLAAATDIPTLAQHHNLTLDQLAAWADSPPTRRDLDTVTRLDALREHTLLAYARVVSLTSLTAVAATPPPDTTTPSLLIRHNETLRKAATHLDRKAPPSPLTDPADRAEAAPQDSPQHQEPEPTQDWADPPDHVHAHAHAIDPQASKPPALDAAPEISADAEPAPALAPPPTPHSHTAPATDHASPPHPLDARDPLLALLATPAIDPAPPRPASLRAA